jgi:predicted metalloprotease with PDZ domain
MQKFIILLLILVICLNASAQTKYSLTYIDSSSQKVKVSIQLAKEKQAPVHFIMPRSIPGSYSVINYDIFIEQLSAVDGGGNKITMAKDDNGAPRWYCTNSGSPVKEIDYEINLRKMEERLGPTDASIIRSGFAGILNYSIFGWIEGMEQEPVECTVFTFDQWPIFSTNQPSASMAKGSFTFNTHNYYTLADGQLFMGSKLRLKEYKGMVPLFVASYCETSDEYLDDYGKQGMMSIEMLHNYFGELPFNEYSILLRKALPLDGVGSMPFGMEHLQSSTFFGDTSGLRKNAMDQNAITEELPTYLHHMGHAFIPLRCYGDGYRPFVKELPPIINNIWFNEGFMWFVPYKILQSKDLKQWFEYNIHKTAPMIKEMNLQLLSQEASLMYASDFRLGQAVVARGAMMAIEMDNYLKKISGGKKSMKDVLRYLYYWSKENKRPFTMKEFSALINKACGIDLSNIYNKWQLPIE